MGYLDSKFKQSRDHIGSRIGGKSAEDRAQGAAMGAYTGYQTGGPLGASIGILGGAAGGRSGIESVKGDIQGKVQATLDNTGVTRSVEGALGNVSNRHQKQLQDTSQQKVQSSIENFKAALGNQEMAPGGTPGGASMRDIKAPQLAAGPSLGQTLLQGERANLTAPQVEATTLGAAPEVGQVDAYGSAEVEDIGRHTASQIGELGDFTPAHLSKGAQDELRVQQLGLTGQLTEQAAGRGPSLAEDETRRAFEQAIASQYAMAAGKGPGALRQAQRNVAQLQGEASAESGRIRLQEQMAAREQLGAALGGIRGQDIGLATTEAGLQQEAQLAGAEAESKKAFSQANLTQEAGIHRTTQEQERAIQNAKFAQETMLTQAELVQQRALTAAGFEQEGRIAQAKMDQDRRMQDAKLASDSAVETARLNAQRDVEQGKITADEAAARFAADSERITQQAKIDQSAINLAHELASREGMNATNAQIEANKAVLQAEIGLADSLNKTKAANDASNKKLFGSALSAAASASAVFV